MRNARTTAFDRDAGFTRRIDPQAARRQFNMSLGLVALIAAASMASALTVRQPVETASREPARLTVQAPQIVHTKQAVRSVEGQIGG